MIKHFRVRKDSGQIFEFDSKSEDQVAENPDLYAESEHSFWVEYTDVYEEYEDQFIKKARWNLYINDKSYGDLETLKMGAIYRAQYPRLLPNIDFGTTNPSYYVFDLDLNEWKSPLFDVSGIKVWDTSLKEYKSIA
jgi:hypothetical protein